MQLTSCYNLNDSKGDSKEGINLQKYFKFKKENLPWNRNKVDC